MKKRGTTCEEDMDKLWTNIEKKFLKSCEQVVNKFKTNSEQVMKN